MLHKSPLQFNYIPYPLWRRRVPRWINATLRPIWQRLYPLGVDDHPPVDAASMADVMIQHGLLPDHSLPDIYAALRDSKADIQAQLPHAPTFTDAAPAQPIRLPAQWEPMEAVIVNWPVMYPPLWDLHAQMVEAIAPVAQAVVTVPAPMWGHAAWVYLQARARLGDFADNIRFMVIPTDDIWVRDYGPIIGFDTDGQRVALDAVYDHKPIYPQQRDDAMPQHWAAYTQTPVYPLRLHTEGGNLWTDGAGTLLMTEQIFVENPAYDRAQLEDYLHSVFVYDKLIITPRMHIEATGHIDLLLKLVNANTVMVSADTALMTNALRTTAKLFAHETNAKGDPYTVHMLPTPELYFNWFAYPIRRSYTNALTINGRVLLPVYGVHTDDAAVRIYEQAMPDHIIIPIDCKVGANGGGAVHCMTKEVPRQIGV
jgi:agmatine deiminase